MFVCVHVQHRMYPGIHKVLNPPPPPPPPSFYSWVKRNTGVCVCVINRPELCSTTCLSRQALLSRLAQTPAGSRELLTASCISYLAQCRFIDLRPDHHDNQLAPGLHGNAFDPSGSGFVPPVSDRYRQLLMPLLKLLLTMLTCPGAQRSEVKSQVCDYHVIIFSREKTLFS